MKTITNCQKRYLDKNYYYSYNIQLWASPARSFLIIFWEDPFKFSTVG
jgi:hypothetical protein